MTRSGLPGKRVSPTRRREVVAQVQRSLPQVGECRACRALGQPRSTQRYVRKVKPDEPALVKAIESLVCQHPSYGYRIIHGLLVADGFKVGQDRVHRCGGTMVTACGKSR